MISLQSVTEKDRELLWNTLTEAYQPEIYHLNEEETVLAFEV